MSNIGQGIWFLPITGSQIAIIQYAFLIAHKIWILSFL